MSDYDTGCHPWQEDRATAGMHPEPLLGFYKVLKDRPF